MAESDIGIALNYTHTYEIQDAEGTWLRVAAGISNVSNAGNETIDQTAYYDGDGMASSDVTGGQLTLTFTGHRKYGDPAQDYVASLALEYGERRKTRFRQTAPDGDVIEGEATIANITLPSGDANAKGDFSFELHLDGRPTLTEGDKTSLPESVSASAVSVKAGATATLEPTVTPDEASGKCWYSSDDDSVATVDSDGVVHGVKAGKCNVTVKCAARPAVSCSVAVTVTAAS